MEANQWWAKARVVCWSSISWWILYRLEDKTGATIGSSIYNKGVTIRLRTVGESGVFGPVTMRVVKTMCKL